MVSAILSGLVATRRKRTSTCRAFADSTPESFARSHVYVLGVRWTQHSSRCSSPPVDTVDPICSDTERA